MEFVCFFFGWFFFNNLGCTLEGNNCSNQESTPWDGQPAFCQKGHTPEAITKSSL